MLVANISEFRKQLKQFIESVIENRETLIINRSNGKAAVLMSLDEYNSIMATQHELRSQTNEARLDRAINKLESNMSREHDLLDTE